MELERPYPAMRELVHAFASSGEIFLHPTNKRSYTRKMEQALALPELTAPVLLAHERTLPVADAFTASYSLKAAWSVAAYLLAQAWQLHR